MTIERPKLRNVEPVPAEVGGRRVIALRDPYRFAEKIMAVPEDIFFIISLFDGERTVLDIQAEYMRRFGDLLFSDRVREIIEEMDSNYLLESERFEARRREVVEKFRRARVLEAGHAGTAYEDGPARLRAQLDGFFLPPEGPGKPAPQPGARPVRGIIAPHIDFLRGGVCYAWAYHALAQSCDAEVFLILGTVHTATKRLFTATRKGFKTPLGTMSADRAFLDRLAKSAGDRLFEDELAHKIEHTIEFQVVFLQHMLGSGGGMSHSKEVKTPCEGSSGPRKVDDRAALRRTTEPSQGGNAASKALRETCAHIVPVLCSSFLESAGAKGPQAVPEMEEFIAALKACIAASKKRVCLIASADLAHVGPQFGDRRPLSPATLSLAESEDRKMLRHAEELDAEGFYHAVAGDHDARHICGLPPIYVLLRTISASEGKLLKYAQAADPSGQGCVSFAAMAFS